MSKSVVVIGAGVGGLSAAIHARLKGHDVLLLERALAVGGKAAGLVHRGYRLDPGPSIVLLPRIYESVFKAAGRQMRDYLRFHRLDPISRVYFEGEPPIDLPADRQACLALVRELYPADYDSFAWLMGVLDKATPHVEKSIFAHPYSKPWQMADPHLVATAMQFDVRKTYKELVDGWFRSPLLRSFFYGFPSYGGQSYDSKAPGALMIPYLMIEDGVYYPEGGVAAIPSAMERLALELGVEIRTGVKIKGFGTRGRSVESVMTDTGEKIEGEAFISNIDRLTTGQMLGRTSEQPPSFSYFTLHWGIREPVSGLQHHTLLVPSEFETGFRDLYRSRRFPERPIVYLNTTSVTDPSSAPTGATNLLAVVTSPAVEPSVDWSNTDVYRARTLDTMLRCGLELSESAVEFERIQAPNYFEQEHGNYRGSLYGPSEEHRLFKLFPLSNRDDEFRNLFYCGGSVQPGAGLPMVTLSGRFAADLV